MLGIVLLVEVPEPLHDGLATWAEAFRYSRWRGVSVAPAGLARFSIGDPGPPLRFDPGLNSWAPPGPAPSAKVRPAEVLEPLEQGRPGGAQACSPGA